MFLDGYSGTLVGNGADLAHVNQALHECGGKVKKKKDVVLKIEISIYMWSQALGSVMCKMNSYSRIIPLFCSFLLNGESSMK